MSSPDSAFSHVTIRRADAADAPDIARILAEAFEAFRPLYTPGGFRATVLTATEIAARLPEGPVWLAVMRPPGPDQPGPVGTVAAVGRAEGLYVRSMGVAPAGRGRGVGRRLLEEVEAFARTAGFCRMYLSTAPVLLDAIRLYERFGFERAAAGAQDLHGTPLFSMEKVLT